MFILHKNIHCDPTSEPSCRDGSDEGSQHMVSMRNERYPSIVIKYPLLSKGLDYQVIVVKPGGVSIHLNIFSLIFLLNISSHLVRLKI